MTAPLLVEIGCEEIPARMIPDAAAELGSRLDRILRQAGLGHGETRVWGGTRRLVVRVEEVEGRQGDREETVLGPPASAAFDPAGAPTAAALGFARKQGVDPGRIRRLDTDKGVYAGFTRSVRGSSIGEVLASSLPQAIETIPFPKAMRWGSGEHRWVRPVHWVVALHGEAVLPLEVFGVRSDRRSRGHRFLAPGAVELACPDAYAEALRSAFVVVDPAERRHRLAEALERAARDAGGTVVDDVALLEEVVDLLEWPGVVAGRFDEAFLDLPREILVTTLRHHQKCFSVQDGERLLPMFLAVANTSRDPSGHIRRGNEWVVGGRLADARFFWNEDAKLSLESRLPRLEGIGFHRGVGSYREKVAAAVELLRAMARRLDLPAPDADAAARAMQLAKADLVTGLVGEFPELQGIVGGLLLRHEGEDPAVARAVYEHYRPAATSDPLPDSSLGCLVSAADKLSTVMQLLGAGETPTSSRDPFGLRRAASGVFRIVEERAWPLGLEDLTALAGQGPEVSAFLEERYTNYLRDRGYTLNEVLAVMKASGGRARALPLHDVAARLEAIKPLRGREDFERLVDLTKRVDNILGSIASGVAAAPRHDEREPAAIALDALVEECRPVLERCAAAADYSATVAVMARFVAPVDRFFEDVLVLDPDNPGATAHRKALLERLRALLTAHFDIRELAGQAAEKSLPA